MPLHVAELPIDPASLRDRPEEFLIFYSSIVDGKMWCPDCRSVDDVVQAVFGAPDGPSAVIVYVGTKPEWRAVDSADRWSNVFRAEPFNIRGVPTIVKMSKKEEVGRLVDAEIKTKLSAFVEGSLTTQT
ncbi:hypothetical protein C8R44DRAFT_883954 [Mycena epipterygia]|nr:hypothetical protein C8R44DRAFT_883954 [Mycena epipterygia]